MERYDSYKDSGVEWIGEIPSGWNHTKMKYLGIYINGYPFKPSDWGDKGKLIIRIQNLTEGRGSENFYDGDIDPKYIIKNGDYLFSWSTTLGLFEWKREDGVLNQHIFKVELNDILFRKFYFWVIQGVIEELSNESHGSTMTHLTKDVFGNIRLPLPPLSEQSQIVRFLDEKTSLIDSLIEKTKRKIELLKEERTSLINHIVTKGLNPNVEMKDSGVEWIGEIPSHWEKKRLKHVSKSTNGYSFKSDDFNKEYDIPVIRIGDVGDIIDFEDCVKVKSHFLEDRKEFQIHRNDILIGLTGGTIGKSGKYNYDSPSLLNQRVGLLRNKDSVLNRLLYHYVKSEVFIRYIFFDCYGGGQDNISMSDILNMVFPSPPLSEQEEIVSFLDDKTTTIDKTIELEGKRIDYLKEYRQSLISEVVTGKIKVITDE